MSGFLNRVQLIGNLGRDPEVRTMQNGGQVVTLSIATTENWKDDRGGERRERGRLTAIKNAVSSMSACSERKGTPIVGDGAGRISSRWQLFRW